MNSKQIKLARLYWRMNHDHDPTVVRFDQGLWLFHVGDERKDHDPSIVMLFRDEDNYWVREVSGNNQALRRIKYDNPFHTDKPTSGVPYFRDGEKFLMHPVLHKILTFGFVTRRQVIHKALECLWLHSVNIYFEQCNDMIEWEELSW